MVIWAFLQIVKRFQVNKSRDYPSNCSIVSKATKINNKIKTKQIILNMESNLQEILPRMRTSKDTKISS